MKVAAQVAACMAVEAALHGLCKQLVLGLLAWYRLISSSPHVLAGQPLGNLNR
jgi:hypothetical protein